MIDAIVKVFELETRLAYATRAYDQGTIDLDAYEDEIVDIKLELRKAKQNLMKEVR